MVNSVACPYCGWRLADIEGADLVIKQRSRFYGRFNARFAELACKRCQRPVRLPWKKLNEKCEEGVLTKPENVL